MTSRPFPLDYLGPFGSRPRLLASIAIGLALGLILAVLRLNLDLPTRALVAWNVGCVAYVAMMLREISSRDAPYIRGVAAAQDPGQGAILALVLVLSATSLAAVAGEFRPPRLRKGLPPCPASFWPSRLSRSRGS